MASNVSATAVLSIPTACQQAPTIYAGIRGVLARTAGSAAAVVVAAVAAAALVTWHVRRRLADSPVPRRGCYLPVPLTAEVGQRHRLGPFAPAGHFHRLPQGR